MSALDIACTVRRSFPGPGGIATALRVTATELARAHTVRVWAARIDAQPLTRLNSTLGAQVFSAMWIDGVEVRPVPMGIAALAATTPMALMTVPGLRSFGYQFLRKSTAPGYVRAVGARLASDWGHPSIVHAWGGEHLNWAAGHAARAHDIPLVITPFAHPGAWGDDPMNIEFYEQADRVLALVPSEAAFYAKLGVDEEKLRVVGVPVTPLPEPTVDVRAQYDIGDAPIVLFLAVKEPYKGYRLLLEASARVWTDHPQTRFVFVGPRTADSESDFARVDDPRIIEIGLVPDSEVAAWQRAATLLCLPSTSEIMPVSILESWQQAVPVVAAEWWCARDLVEHEKDGLLVPADAGAIARALIAVIGDEAGARAMGAAGKQKVADRFTPAAVAARHEAAYQELV